MNKIIPSVIENNGEYYIHIEEYKTLKQLVEHYEHLYSEVKKQKDDVVEYIKEKWDYVLKDITFLDHDELVDRRQIKNILRMLGEIDETDNLQ